MVSYKTLLALRNSIQVRGGWPFEYRSSYKHITTKDTTVVYSLRRRLLKEAMIKHENTLAITTSCFFTYMLFFFI